MTTTGSIRAHQAPIAISDLGTVDYEQTWHRQAEAATRVAAGDIPDQLWLLQHPATYTAGKRTEPEDRPQDGTPVVDVDRGGRITWHGPGQLVCYPIVKLREPLDVVDYVRRIEEAIIHVVAEAGLPQAGRVEGRSGVWLPPEATESTILPARKIAAIGIRVTRGTTMHGLALNCDCSLDAYESIVPCGIADAGVTSLSAELGRTVPVSEVQQAMADAVVAALEGTLPVAPHGL
ncbi:lipoyl(octanoyl) transferase LipB [Corynebacterium sp. TAE3-ERU12]|uniref:lipoyl(octanoyl) transferase LipB n=1 Tax=Corynebacterium sp. TAE3-ERU12 TaxID=2849491 RepID=UPI001C43B56D|nr:lipoyl(octanoyl) transferase LipB [Corynebacterium sp. TAE3-ERU12]MBV7295835.1 lipoyl(octanoyl) transferase LipB [Corynebacterium sp. TAE3-ERU12]